MLPTAIALRRQEILSMPCRHLLKSLLFVTLLMSFRFPATRSAFAAEKVFRAGAAAIDVSPTTLPVIVNGNMVEALATEIHDRLHARALVLDDGTNQIAIVIVDNCMMPRELLDDAKKLASEATKIPANRMLIAATHCHSAPSVHGCLGSGIDIEYAKFLPGKIAEAIIAAQKRLVPARIGWGIGRDEKNVGSRRWLMRHGAAPNNEFSGKSNDLAQMHPGFNNPKALRPTGPVDPEVPVVSVQTRDGKPIATLTNYSMHYVGAKAISADYFALVCSKLGTMLKADEDYVGMHSNGTSGDQWLMDYTLPSRREFSLDSVSTDVSAAAFAAYGKIEYFDWVPVVMEERLLELKVRLAGADELERAKKVVDGLAGRKPRTLSEVYAREAVLLSEMPPTRELKLQAIRVGGLGIAAIPNEVFAITGVTIKQRSPLKPSFTIELANGCEGYIPPPDQHALGGYETWRARTSCLEETAEVKIVSTVLDLLDAVAAGRKDEPAVPSGRAGGSK
jgi:neutral ceramidase